MPAKSNRKLIDLTGQPFGRLTVLCEGDATYQGATRHRRRTWDCECRCGNLVNVSQRDLSTGHTQSCGCLERDTLIARNKARKPNPNSMSNLPEYDIWCGMKKRCYSPKYAEFHLYGGSGVTICDRWRYSFKHFYADMGKRPTPTHSIDRYPNKFGNYEPNNCRWATPFQQAQNKSNNHNLTYQGVTLCLAEWARRCHMYVATLERRIKRGWTVEQVLTTPSRKTGKCLLT